ncbi:MAG: RNA-binding protein [Lachnospiraceae bacterium]|nr:RNA-binding protein [Lachnospiraceae bacterium]
MIQLGKIQALNVVKKTDFGVYLGKEELKVLLPKKQVSEDLDIGDAIEVYVYKDSMDRIIATTKKPYITLGQLAVLEVKEVAKVGAFLDCGLEKDLLLPFKEQTYTLNAKDKCLVVQYIDKSDRLCASMKVYEHLSSDSPYSKDDRVSGFVYDIKKGLGAFVAVDNKYSALIEEKELLPSVKRGMVVNARVTKVREDGKLNLSLREKSYIQMDDDAKIVFERIEAMGGRLPFTDKADAEFIKEEFNMSKNAFKRAVGRLLKEDKIVINEDSIIKK